MPLIITFLVLIGNLLQYSTVHDTWISFLLTPQLPMYTNESDDSRKFGSSDELRGSKRLDQETIDDEAALINRRRHDSTILHGLNDDLSSSQFTLHEFTTPSFVKTTSRYEILDEIDRGGMGIIYQARDWHLHRMVAIKLLRHEFCDRPRLVQRFTNEARVMGALQHPGIAHIYECGFSEDGRPFHSMMLVTGATLSKLLEQRTGNRISTTRLLNVFAKLCDTMAYVHSRGIYHLDLKPANCMVGEFGEVIVMDWGLAQFADEEDDRSLFQHVDDHSSKQHHVQGTLAYMSPEQANGEMLDQRTDVFCLGAILYEILTGEVLYPGEDRATIHGLAVEANLENAIQKLKLSNAPPPLLRLAVRCLAKRPQDRPHNAKVLADALTEYQSSKLEISHHDLTRFFELSLDLFCIADNDGFFQRINANFSRVLGHSESELLSSPFIDFVHPEDVERTILVMQALNRGEPVVRFRNRYRTRSEQFMELEWTAKSIVEENLIFAVARIITEPEQSLKLFDQLRSFEI